MKKILLIIASLFVLMGTCSANANEFTFLGAKDGIATFLYNDDIHVSGKLYQFHLVVRNANTDTTTVLTVLANKKEYWYVTAGALVELPNGDRYETKGSSDRLCFGNNSPVDRAIHIIDNMGGRL